MEELKLISKQEFHMRITSNPVGKIAEKSVCGSVFLTIWHGILSAELKKHILSDRLFFDDFAHWEEWRSRKKRLFVTHQMYH